MVGFRMLARVAALLLVASLPTATTGALPVPRAVAAVGVDADSDGDGLSDTRDGCPTISSANPTGCPSAGRRASLVWVKAKQRLEGRVASPVTACSARARIVLWRVRANRDDKLVGANATARGRYRFTVRRGSRYYVSVSPSYASGQAECTRATSRTVLARRR